MTRRTQQVYFYRGGKPILNERTGGQLCHIQGKTGAIGNCDCYRQLVIKISGGVLFTWTKHFGGPVSVKIVEEGQPVRWIALAEIEHVQAAGGTVASFTETVETTPALRRRMQATAG